MFERLDAPARQIVDLGIAEAHRLGDTWYGTEHLLIGVLARRGDLPVQAQELLPDVELVRRRLQHRLRRRSAGMSEDELLASLGIDLTEVRRRAAEVFGVEAVQRAAVRARGRGRPMRRRRRRRRCEQAPRPLRVPGESLMMAPRLKKSFDRAGRRCEQLGQASISAPVLAAALLGVKGALAAELLEAAGVDVRRARVALDPG